ncbi:hypothetical protein HY570_04385 [Candidatus Micrarchaeota archaeon]|nr:hypothetical protein [Candidatus Micrarchaeota archaeon]
MVDVVPWETTSTIVQGAWQDWQVIAVISVFITFLLISIAYMLSGLFSLPDMRRWAKAEFIQSLASILIIGFLIIMIELLISKGTAVALVVSGESPLIQAAALDEKLKGNPFAIANVYIDTVLACSKQYYRWLMFISFAEIAQTGSIQAAGFEFAPGWPLGGLVSSVQMASNNLVFAMIANYFQRNILLFIQDVMLTVFLPAGIILRIFPFTRGAGAVMMAVAIGLYVVYPLSYGLLLLFSGNQTTTCSLDEPPPEMPRITASSPKGLAESVYYAELKRPEHENVMSRIISNTSLFIVQAFLYPIVAIIIAFTFIRALAEFLGADVAELGRGLIKLI